MQVTAEASAWQVICVAWFMELLTARMALPLCPTHLSCPSTHSVYSKVSAFFMHPYSWRSFVTAGSAGFVSRLQGVPKVLPLTDRLLL